jgi:uncharacterized protein YggT (Ycf19 family)
MGFFIEKIFQLSALVFLFKAVCDLLPEVGQQKVLNKTDPFTEPVLNKVREYVPSNKHDFSPWIATFVIAATGKVLRFLFA